MQCIENQSFAMQKWFGVVTSLKRGPGEQIYRYK